MIEVRPARPEDAATLVALGTAVGREEGAWLLTSAGWRGVNEERRYLRALRRYPDAAVYVAEEDGAIVGRLSLARDPHPASHHVADLGLMVAATHRRRGIGRALLEQAVTWARDAGCGWRKPERILKLVRHRSSRVIMPALRAWRTLGRCRCP